MPKAVPAEAKPAIQSDEDAGIEAQEYMELHARVEQLDADEVAEIAAVKQKFENLRKPLAEERDKKFARVQAWAEATRDGRKTIKFPNGRQARWRFPSNPGLVLTGRADTVAKAILRLRNWDKYLSIEFKRNNIKADLGELRGIRRYFRLNQKEYFRIG